jgi:hypothetical protein
MNIRAIIFGLIMFPGLAFAQVSNPGTVTLGTSGQFGWYSSTGSTIAGNSNVTSDASGNITTAGSQIATGVGPALAAVDGLRQLYTSGTGWLGVGVSDGLSIGSGNLTAGGIPSTTLAIFDQYGHFAPSQASSPSIASGACGTGTNGSISGTDQSGKITISSAVTTACAVTFGNNYTTAPKACVFSPASSASAATTVLAYISALSASGFTLSGSVLASTSFYYECE